MKLRCVDSLFGPSAVLGGWRPVVFWCGVGGAARSAGRASRLIRGWRRFDRVTSHHHSLFGGQATRKLLSSRKRLSEAVSAELAQTVSAGLDPLLSGLDFSTMPASQRGRSCSQKESRWGRPRRKSQRSLLFRRAKGPKRLRETQSRTL